VIFLARRQSIISITSFIVRDETINALIDNTTRLLRRHPSCILAIEFIVVRKSINGNREIDLLWVLKTAC